MDALLEPPVGFDLELPTVHVPEQPWFRVHLGSYGAVYFDHGASSRFDAPDGSFGVMYAAESAEGAFAETALRARKRPLRVTERFLHERALSVLHTRALRLVDLCGVGLLALGLDARIAVDECYALAQRWSSWIHRHPAQVDGILYPARQLPRGRSLALFDRVEPVPEAHTLARSLLPSPHVFSPELKQHCCVFGFGVLPGTW